MSESAQKVSNPATAPGPPGLAESLAPAERFVRRHIGPTEQDIAEMARLCGFESLEALVEAALPPTLRSKAGLNLPPARSEHEVLEALRAIAAQNQVFRSFIGMGYYGCVTPPVIQRNILENPGWYTAYTPYQAEIAQGRLEALLNFQTMIIDLTGLEVANASLLDEATAAAEAVTMCYGLKGRPEAAAVLVADSCHPQTIGVVQTRAAALGIEVVVADPLQFDFSRRVFAALVQYPTTDGAIPDYRPFVQQAHAHDALVIAAADPLALTLLMPPGEWGADVAVGSTQRFGVPPGYGGPHAAYLATRDAFKRHLPGRLVGVSKDAQGRPALRLALQTREQHIRREKATSNICTAQVLLAVMAALYAVYHGPDGLRRIARRIHDLTGLLAAGLKRLGHGVPDTFFDTLRIRVRGWAVPDLVALAAQRRINFRVYDAQTAGVALDETTSVEDVRDLLEVFNGGRPLPFALEELGAEAPLAGAIPLPRTTPFLTHPVFNRYHSETEMLRYIRRLEARDLSLTTSMIPLGSCTMKLNPTAAMLPVSWPEFARLHPFAPPSQAQGYQRLFNDLEQWLAEITGFSAVSLQPNAGSQGEYAGLLVIRKYHQHRGQGQRRVCLIPTSAHGTNPASAVLAGLTVVPVKCDAEGNIDLTDLRAKAQEHRQDLAALMVTYPSTHGVFEEGIREICQIVHQAGGQVYLDGANLNAMVGLSRPAELGADVCHINLHKTFAIPHGGGGPGMGPICVAAHLAPFLPTHPVVPTGGSQGIGPVSAAPWGSASILVIPWVYIRLMGADGLTRASQVAILNANYVARRLAGHFPVLYQGQHGLVAHECILDLRGFKTVTVEDVAKRLMDFGFHAPTVSWPVPGTLMVEPTESESKAELDRFCDALLAIHAEMLEVESGRADPANNPLKHAPHTAEVVGADQWDRPYSRAQAAWPAPWLRTHKFWPPVSRIDNVWGDRHPVCSCAGLEALGG